MENEMIYFVLLTVTVNSQSEHWLTDPESMIAMCLFPDFSE